MNRENRRSLKVNQKTNIDWPLIRRLAYWANKAYQTSTASDKATDAQALVTMEHDGIVIAFRGSSSPQDFLQDAKFVRKELIWSLNDSPAEVHAGFLQDFDALNVAVVSQVRTKLEVMGRVIGQPKIYITGHSLGGALAILCAIELSRQKLPIASVVTFGQPRVGNAAFRDIYNHSLGDRTFHVVNANDPVPLAPPLLFGYRDEGNEIFLPRHEHAAVNPSIGFTLISDLLGALNSWRHRQLAFIPNHLMKAYLERIQLA